MCDMEIGVERTQQHGSWLQALGLCNRLGMLRTLLSFTPAWEVSGGGLGGRVGGVDGGRG